MMRFEECVDVVRHPLSSAAFVERCRSDLQTHGALVLPDFLTSDGLTQLVTESMESRSDAYFCRQDHSVYLTPEDPSFPAEHAANRKVVSSKGCICDDMIGTASPLRVIYDNPIFRTFVCEVTGQSAVHPYADTLSSLNIHYAERGQELGWHFDNSSFAITLLIQKPEAGGKFEYVKDFRNAEAGEMNYDGVAALLEGQLEPETLAMEPGTLVLFRGRNSIHRVSPNASDRTRMLAVLAYNAEPDIALSESARMTFYGRLG